MNKSQNLYFLFSIKIDDSIKRVLFQKCVEDVLGIRTAQTKGYYGCFGHAVFFI